MITCPNCNHVFDPNQKSGSLVDLYTNQKSILQARESGVDNSVKKAEPTVSQYRERFKQRALRSEDVTPKKVIPRVVNQDGQLNNFTYKGESLFFGSGTEVEY